MPEQKRVTKQKVETKQVEEVKVKTKTDEAEKSAQDLKDELDDLLASIDEALGEELLAHALEFTQGFVQKGGE